jgi:hypothetical protein
MWARIFLSSYQTPVRTTTSLSFDVVEVLIVADPVLIVADPNSHPNSPDSFIPQLFLRHSWEVVRPFILQF